MNKKTQKIFFSGLNLKYLLLISGKQYMDGLNRGGVCGQNGAPPYILTPAPSFNP